MTEKDLREFTETRIALLEAEYFLASARVAGCPYVKFIHSEGRVSLLLRQLLRRLKREGRLQFLVKGENFSLTNAETRYLIDRYPEIAEDGALEKADATVTVVCLTV